MLIRSVHKQQWGHSSVFHESGDVKMRRIGGSYAGGVVMMRLFALALTFAVGGFVTSLLAAEVVPAFPGAEGFGAGTPGGRGGKLVEVMNLNDKGPGSLRAAIGVEGPRTVVFRVGGTIEVESPLVITNPFITIAGQTAPGGGITLKNGSPNVFAPLQVKTHDVVIRYLRSRPGPSGVPPDKQDGSNVDALTIADPQTRVYNVMVDHCSFSWSVDEVLNSWYDAGDITVQWCIMSEGLHNPTDRKGSGSKGPLFGGKGSDRISAHHNLMAHNVGRNPMVKASGLVDLVNNVIFVPRTVAAVVDGELGPCHVNLVGNNVIAPHGDGLVFGVAVLTERPVSLFVRGNLGPHRLNDDQSDTLFVSPQNGGRSRMVERRGEAPPITAIPAKRAYEEVLASAGCRLPMQDAVDERIIRDVKAGRTRVISDPTEVGGWPALPAGKSPADSDHDGMPDEWERQHGFDPMNPDGTGDADANGYTNLEEFLNAADRRRN